MCSSDLGGATGENGAPQQGDVLSVSNTLEDADGMGEVSYQWQANGKEIAGATGETLEMTQDLVGKAISVVASYTDEQGTTESVPSDATEVVLNVNDEPTGAVTIGGATGENGAPQQGDVLSVSNTLEDADGMGEVSYQWQEIGRAHV